MLPYNFGRLLGRIYDLSQISINTPGCQFVSCYNILNKSLSKDRTSCQVFNVKLFQNSMLLIIPHKNFVIKSGNISTQTLRMRLSSFFEHVFCYIVEIPESGDRFGG